MRELSSSLGYGSSEGRGPERSFQKLVDYCRYYDLPLEHIVETLDALKVVPMIRGISFEFTVSDLLRDLLPDTQWKVEKPAINAQLAIQDVDVLVTHVPTQKKFTIECKLSSKNSFSVSNENQATIKVKCMRSRTVNSPRAATPLATRYGVSVEDVLRHKDNYRDVDFDFVVTSIGNAFWRTSSDGLYTFLPTQTETDFLRRLLSAENASLNQLKEKAFDYMLIASSSQLKVSPENKLRCVRKECIRAGTSNSCGFIPNYPIVNLQDYSVWRPIKKAEELLEAFVGATK